MLDANIVRFYYEGIRPGLNFLLAVDWAYTKQAKALRRPWARPYADHGMFRRLEVCEGTDTVSLKEAKWANPPVYSMAVIKTSSADISPSLVKLGLIH